MVEYYFEKSQHQATDIGQFYLLQLHRPSAIWQQGCRLFLSFLLMLISLQTLADSKDVDVQGDPIVGKTLAASERCQECHGEEGNSADSRIPKHAGQYANYLIKQLRDFQSGARQHEVMTVMAEDLNEANMADIAAYFASQTTMQGSPIGDYPLAKRLFFDGDKNRSIEPCSTCHGEQGKGKTAGNISYPVIGGQNKNYLRAQLVNWKLGERSNSPNGVMNRMAKSLTDDEIDALANYLSGL